MPGEEGREQARTRLHLPQSYLFLQRKGRTRPNMDTATQDTSTILLPNQPELGTGGDGRRDDFRVILGHLLKGLEILRWPLGEPGEELQHKHSMRAVERVQP